MQTIITLKDLYTCAGVRVACVRACICVCV